MFYKISLSIFYFFIFGISFLFNTAVYSQEINSDINRQISELTESEIINKAFQFILDYDDQTVRNQIHLNEIPAPPFMEEQRAERFAEMMREFGLENVEIDAEGNAIGRIGGGTSVNSIPFSNWMEVDMRSIDQQRLFQIDEILQASIHKGVDEANDMRTRGPELTVDVEMIGNRPSGEIDPENPSIQRAMAATHYFGNEPNLVRSSTDSNVPISLGIPAMTLGGGGSSGAAHSLDEWWYNDEGHKGVQRALLILIAEAGLHR
jgi:acetylornithine deacetylase/succinyl-diaminopimelate desuccinylase-like protein